jgi:hypothetical protein
LRQSDDQNALAPRYLIANGAPARLLQHLQRSISRNSGSDSAFMFLSLVGPIRFWGDFVRQVYMARSAPVAIPASSIMKLRRAFVERGIDDGLTLNRWYRSDGAAGTDAYLTGCCADFGLLEKGQDLSARLSHTGILPSVAAYLAYELHFAGLQATMPFSGRMVIGSCSGWREKMPLKRLKRLSLKGLLIVQAGGGDLPDTVGSTTIWRSSPMSSLRG